VTIPTENPWNSSQLEYSREPRDSAEAGQRRKCHIIDLLECSKIAGCHVRRFGRTCTKHQGRTSHRWTIGSRPHADAKPSAWHPVPPHADAKPSAWHPVLHERGNAENVT
jgi:hypothetical protein